MGKTTPNKEQAILQAAEHEFLTKGFDGARTTSIAQAAGVTHAMLHYYFRTKEHIFNRILDEKMRLMGQSILTAIGQSGLPLQERLSDAIGRLTDRAYYNSLSYEERQRYTLALSERYLKALERFRREREFEGVQKNR